MTMPIDGESVEALRGTCVGLTGASDDYDSLVEELGDSQLVLLGEASHGTREFYRERARITRRLIEEQGFCALAVEADWPDAYRVNRFVLGAGDDESPRESLGDFQRFPAWMWRNREVLEFIDWLSEANGGRHVDDRGGFYGLDLYSLHASIRAVISHLEEIDPDAASMARRRYDCFDHSDRDSQSQEEALGWAVFRDCEDEAVAQLLELQARRAQSLTRDGSAIRASDFYAEQNARVVRNAEQYYRTMYRSDISSWNLRDQHMAETLEALQQHLGAERERPKIVVWAHNSHLGDARATEMGTRGELNLGQLIRERVGDGAKNVGFTTATGWVSAARDWGAEVERRQVQPPLEGSYEDLLHSMRQQSFWLNTAGAAEALTPPRLERAIGVIYRPETERWSHYFQADLPRQFDYLVHFDSTEAVEPLEYESIWEQGEVPQTFPSRF